MSKEIPILCSTTMVQAMLAGRKTLTRRTKGLEEYNKMPNEFKIVPRDVPSGFQAFKKGNTLGVEQFKTYWDDVKCPYGKAGDILWVRESWQWMEGFAGSGYYVFKADFHLKNGEWIKDVDNRFHDVEVVRKWKPSIHLEKIAARIWLEVTDIRVERLQEISEEDAKAEGVQPNTCDDPAKCPSSLKGNGCCGDGEYHNYLDKSCEGEPCYSAVESFESLWQSINGPESWNTNPWVWVVSFKILSTTGKP